MLRDAARARIQNTLAFRTDKEAEIVNALQDAQVILEQGAELPWFLKTEVSSISTVSGEERIPIPNDFLREDEDDSLWFFEVGTGGDDDTWIALAKEDVEFLRKKYPGSADTPIAYSLDEKYFRIFPTPDSIYTLKMVYYRRDTDLTSNIENDWLKYFPYLLIGEAGRLFSPGLRDKDATAQFSRWAAEGRIAMLVANEARMHSGRRYVMGGQD